MKRRELLALAGAAFAPQTAAQGIAVVTQEITVSKNDANEAAKSLPKDGEKPSTAAKAGNKAEETVNKVPGGESATKVFKGIGGRFGKANTAGADKVISDKAVLSAKEAPTVVVYGDKAFANDVADAIKKSTPADIGAPVVAILLVDPSSKGNKDFDDHFNGKKGNVTVYPKGAGADKAVTLSAIGVASGKLVETLNAKPASAAPELKK